MFSFLSLLIACGDVEDSSARYTLLQSDMDISAMSPSIIPSEMDGYNSPSLILGDAYVDTFRDLAGLRPCRRRMS